MNIKDYIDNEDDINWNEVAEIADISEDVEGLNFFPDECEILDGGCILIYGDSNGCTPNDPNLSGLTLTIVLDENLNQIDSETEYF